MSRYILSLVVAVTLTSCGGVAESREDLDSEAFAQEAEEDAYRTMARPTMPTASMTRMDSMRAHMDSTRTRMGGTMTHMDSTRMHMDSTQTRTRVDSSTTHMDSARTRMGSARARMDSTRTRMDSTRTRTDSVRTMEVRAIPAGTVLTFEVREDVSSSSHEAGDGFALVLLNAVDGVAGAALFAGTEARGEVTNVHASSGPDDESLLGVRVATVEAGGSQTTLHGTVQSADVEASTRDSGARSGATVAIGTAAGAILGQILGGDTRSTVRGAAVGTAVGIGVALTTRGGHATLPEGSRIVVKLDRDLIY